MKQVVSESFPCPCTSDSSSPSLCSHFRSSSRGFTLVEILVSLIVLSIGFLGIMFLFPISMKANTESVEESQAAFIAESIKEAINNSFKNARLDSATKKYEVHLSHDIKTDNQNVIYRFNLPLPEEQWVHHPGAMATSGSLEELPAFELNADPWIAKASDDVRDKFGDHVNIYEQFVVSFDIKCANPNNNLQQGVPQDQDYGYYEVRINVFRKQAGNKKKLITVLPTAKVLK